MGNCRSACRPYNVFEPGLSIIQGSKRWNFLIASQKTGCPRLFSLTSRAHLQDEFKYFNLQFHFWPFFIETALVLWGAEGAREISGRTSEGRVRTNQRFDVCDFFSQIVVLNFGGFGSNLLSGSLGRVEGGNAGDYRCRLISSSLFFHKKKSIVWTSPSILESITRRQSLIQWWCYLPQFRGPWGPSWFLFSRPELPGAVGGIPVESWPSNSIFWRFLGKNGCKLSRKLILIALLFVLMVSEEKIVFSGCVRLSAFVWLLHY